jgi:hypothetical protein
LSSLSFSADLYCASLDAFSVIPHRSHHGGFPPSRTTTEEPPVENTSTNNAKLRSSKKGMATGGATTGTGDSAIFGEKPILYLDVMDETEPVDHQLSCCKEDPGLAETTVRMAVSTDGNRTGASDILANSSLRVDGESKGMVTVVTVDRMV